MSEAFLQSLNRILAADKRYTRDAYVFVFEALRFTQQKLGQVRHVSGRELLEGIRDHARDQFGGMARFVLQEWGIRTTDDFGEIVFLLVEHELMGKTDTDCKEDFHDVYRFDDVFGIDTPEPPSV